MANNKAPHTKGRYKGIGPQGDEIKYSLNDLLFLWSQKPSIDLLYHKMRSFMTRRENEKNYLSVTEYFKANKIDLHLIKIFKELQVLDENGEWAAEGIEVSMIIDARLKLLEYYRKVRG